MFHLHPSATLRRLFAAKPYQGADPGAAEFLFVGLDANYSESIEEEGCLTEVEAYLKDGVGYWQARGVHHPFLLPTYRGDGALYHRQFAKIGFRPRHAPLVSFIELLHLPTFGRSTLVPQDLDSAHLERLEAWIIKGAARYAFVPPGVLRHLRQSGRFGWLSAETLDSRGSLPVIFRSAKTTVFSPFHFSCVGQYCPKTLRDQQIRDIGGLIGDR